MFLARPSPVLSPFIRQYWMIDHRFAWGDRHRQRIVPSGLLELTFYGSDLPKMVGSSLVGRSLLTGQVTAPYDLLVSGHLSIFSVSFQPQGAARFFDLPMIELLGRQISIQDLLGAEVVARLEDDLWACSSFFSRIEVMEKFLFDRLRFCSTGHDLSRISDAISFINARRGVTTVATLASRACLSRKQFERVFQQQVGLSPKNFLRIVRWQRVIYERQRREDLTLTDLAYDCGYYDQSHMISEFKKLSGQTPSSYFSECPPYSDYWEPLNVPTAESRTSRARP